MLRLCLLAFLVALPPVGGEEPKPLSLRDYAAKGQSRHAYGVYVQNKKIGWAVIESKLVKEDGKESLRVIDETFFEIKRGDDGIKMHVLNTYWFAVEGDGDILRIEEKTDESNRKVTRKGERKGERFVITNSTAPNKQRKLAPPKRNLANQRKLEDWLAAGPKKDAKFESFGVSLEDAEIDTPETYTYVGKKTLLLAGVKTELHNVSVKSKGAVSDMDVLADGTPVRGTVGGFLEMRTEPEAQAKKLEPAEVDILALASIGIDKELGNADRIESLTLEISGLGDYALPTGPRQKLVKKKDRLLLELRRDFKQDKTEPLADAEKKKMLAATPTVQSDEKEVKELAEKIVGKETDIHKQAQAIRRWVYDNLRKSYDANATTTLEVLKSKAGDCTEHSLMFVSLARAVGVPAREVGGVGYYSNGQPMFGWHAWGEFHDGHQWVACDPTWNQERVDATHVKFSDSADDMAWVNVLGKVKFKLVSVEKK